MTERNSGNDFETLDRLADEIRNSTLDPAEASAAADRVWRRLSEEYERPLRGCEDFQALLPALVAGELPAARALLVEDHTRECVPCRRALLESRGDVTAAARRPESSRSWKIPRPLKIAAVAVVIVGAGLLGARTIGNLIADQRLIATIAEVDGTLHLVESNDNRPLAAGGSVRSRQIVRTAKNSGAELRLGDGSVVEVDARSELELRGAMRGTTIRLHRGNIIVHAAEQQGGRLSVATDDCLVAVRGTIFAVDHGLKGSRVSVIEGEVEVYRPGVLDVLAPGEQVTTDDRIHMIAIEDQIAWSRNAEEHTALLRELTRLQRDVIRVVDHGELRTSTRLLDLVPDDTALYAAIPNLAEGLGDARRLVEERIASNATLQAWWQDNVIANGVDRRMNEALDRLEPLGAALGDEVVVAVPITGFTHQQGPLVLASLDDPAAFARLLADEVARANSLASKTVLRIVDNPMAAADSPAEMTFWIHEDLVAAATGQQELAALAARATTAGAKGFDRSELYVRLRDAYRRGVTWLVGVDLESVVAAASVDIADDERQMLDRLGVLDATSLIFTHSRQRGIANVEAGMYFGGPRRGVAAWLADPAPMGSLDFVSPQASVAAAVVAKDGAVMFDELLNTLASTAPEAIAEIRRFEQEVGFDLRADLAAPLGGEAAFALDGPLLPVPSWKLILEVYDPETFQSTIEAIVTRADEELRANDLPGVALETTLAGGREYHTIRHPSADFAVVYTVVDGYIVMAPQRPLIDQALQFRQSGVILTDSATFRGLLPDNGYTDCSALFYRNLAPLAGALPAETVPPELRGLLEESAEPSLFCVYGETDRILLSGTGGSLLGAAPLMGLSNLMTGCGPRLASEGQVSSAG
jgi:hypothetical protein